MYNACSEGSRKLGAKIIDNKQVTGKHSIKVVLVACIGKMLLFNSIKKSLGGRVYNLISRGGNLADNC